MDCKLLNTCPGSDYCWKGTCVLKDTFDNVTAKAPDYMKPIYRDILKALAQGKNIFLTAPGGCGKTYLLNQLSKSLGSTITLTATTGVAALNIGGATIHSTLGLGLGNKSVDAMLKGLNPFKLDFLNRIQVLAVDEVSMLSGSLLNKCNEFLKKARMNKAPFGGIQVILIGDFCQLPPVEKDNTGILTKDFCFKSAAWEELNLAYFHLKHNFRQQDDPAYADILNLLRIGELTEDGYNLIKSRELDPPEDIPRLYATNQEVFEYNTQKLKELGSEIKTFKATYKSDIPGVKNNASFYLSLVDKMKKYSIAEDELSLCEGARVMLLRNLDLDAGLVNGSLGYVTCFCEDSSILVKFDNGSERYIKRAYVDMYDAEGKVLISQVQYPIKLAYGLTSHKAQGATLDKVFVDFDRFFEINQGYVALSRVKKSSGLYVRNFRTTAFRFSPEVLDFYRKSAGLTSSLFMEVTKKYYN